MTAKRVSSARSKGARDAAPVMAASVVELGEDGRVTVRASAGEGHTEPLEARVAEIAGYRPTVGDRVVVARGGGEAFVVAVLAASAPPALALPDGTTAAIEGDAIELRDKAGRLLVRYADGVAEVSAPERDLRLVAPKGRVVIEAASDVSISAARDLSHRAGRRVELGAGDPAAPAQVRVEPAATRVAAARLEVEAKSSRLVTGQATVVARAIATTAETLAQNVGNYELTATKIVEKTRDAFRDVGELLQQRVGRYKTIVDDVYSLYSRRSVMQSKEETSIDGEKILLG